MDHVRFFTKGENKPRNQDEPATSVEPGNVSQENSKLPGKDVGEVHGPRHSEQSDPYTA